MQRVGGGSCGYGNERRKASSPVSYCFEHADAYLYSVFLLPCLAEETSHLFSSELRMEVEEQVCMMIGRVREQGTAM